MTWPIASAVGFVLATFLVIVMARCSTARWEREKRAERATSAAPVRVSRLAWGRTETRSVRRVSRRMRRRIADRRVHRHDDSHPPQAPSGSAD
jgi:uncharacterized membrane protein